MVWRKEWINSWSFIWLLTMTATYKQYLERPSLSEYQMLGISNKQRLSPSCPTWKHPKASIWLLLECWIRYTLVWPSKVILFIIPSTWHLDISYKCYCSRCDFNSSPCNNFFHIFFHPQHLIFSYCTNAQLSQGVYI